MRSGQQDSLLGSLSLSDRWPPSRPTLDREEPVKQVQKAFKKAGIDEMRLKAMVLEAECHWAIGARADAVAVAERLLADPKAASAPDAFDQAANIVAGRSPTPEMDSIPSIDQI